MNRFYLWLVTLLNPLLVRLGVNTPQLHAILKAKLLMDDRRPNAYTAMRQKRKQDGKSNGSWAVILVSLLMGFFYLVTLFASPDHLMQMFLWFFVYLIMMTITLISDFTSVLIDVKDNFVILPKPVNDRTVVASRLLHIIIHISKIIVPLSLPAFVLLLLRDGLVAGFWFITLVMMASIFGIFIVNAIYLIALKLTTPNRFKEVINYVQIVFSVVVFGSYYLAPRLLQESLIKEINLLDYPWLNVLPPFWFSSAWTAVVDGVYTTPMVSYIILVLLIPFVSLWLVVKVFAPSFNRKLAMLSSSGGEGPAVVKNVNVAKRPFYKRIAKLVCRGKEETTGFELVWVMTGRMRDFKLKVYPSIAYVFVYFVYFMATNKQGSISAAWRNLPETNMFILLIYISSFVFVTAITNLVYSDKYKSSWVYHSAPVATPGRLLMGAFKATLVKFFFPFYMVVAIFTLYMWGVKTIPDLLLGFINVVLINLVFALIFLRKLPFSSLPNIKQSSGTLFRGVLILLVPGGIGVAHYYSSGHYWLLLLFAILSLAGFYLVYGSYRDTRWARLEV